MASPGVAEPEQGWWYFDQGRLQCEPFARSWQLVQQQRTRLRTVFRTSMRVLGIICINSQPFKVGIVPRLFFWITDSLRKILTNFGNFSHPTRPVGKPNQPVH